MRVMTRQGLPSTVQEPAFDGLEVDVAEMNFLVAMTYLLMLLRPCLLLAWRRMPSWPPQLGVVGARSCVRPVCLSCKGYRFGYVEMRKEERRGEERNRHGFVRYDFGEVQIISFG